MSNIQTHNPTHRVYAVKGEGKTARWIRIGAAWPNRDGRGFSFQMDAMPFLGRIVMREIAEQNGGQQ